MPCYCLVICAVLAGAVCSVFPFFITTTTTTTTTSGMIKSLDRFIERSAQLLEARPDTARVSTTYTHRRAKHGGENVSAGGFKPATMTVKTYDPVSGACYRIRIHKSNELSRIMSSLGPRSITLTSGAKSKKIPGMASVMAAVDPVEEDQLAAAAAAAASAGNTGAKSKNKNKKK